MRNKYIISLILGLSLLIASCSKTKFSGFRQYTSNFISYYNTYFNVKQLYKIGYRESVQFKQETTSDIISIFEYENDPQLFEATAQFKSTAPKVGKLLSLRPYTKWVDDAILIEGKIRYLKGDLDSAIQLLAYLVDYYPKGYIAGHLPGGKLKGYDELVRNAIRKKEPMHQPKGRFKFARNEGIIWLAKAYIKAGSYDRATNLIYMAEADMGYPVEYRKDLMKVKIMLNIAKKEYVKTNEYLNMLLSEYKLSKKEKGRIYFILGQLSEHEKKYKQASDYFQKALAESLKSDLEFEAKLRMLTYSSESNTIDELRKMLKKGKYEQNIDKIYFAIGNILMEKKKTNEAMESYKKAIANSKNSNQKFFIYDKLGSIFYDIPDYLVAAQYYDSAQRVIPQNFPNKKEFMKKVEALNRLLIQYNIYKSKDSVLELAALGPEKAKAKIEKQIKKEFEEEKSKALFMESQVLNKETVNATSLGGNKQRQWYFSSTENVDKGRIMFQKKWGKLLLKDNWLLANSANNTSNPALNAPQAGDNAGAGESASTDIVAEIEASKLPFSNDAKKPFIKDVQQALVNMARIYHYEIKDIKKAIETYELLFKKYGKNLDNEDEHLYSLYRLHLEYEDVNSAEQVKADLISRYPNSKYTLYALNPNAKSQEEKSDLAVARLYKEAYSKYQKTYYSEAMDICNKILEQYPEHKLVPKVKLLKAFIFSYTYNADAYVKILQEILQQHKDAEEAKYAKEYLDIHLKLKSEAVVSKEINKEVYSNVKQDIPEVKPNASLSEVIERSKEIVKENTAPTNSKQVTPQDRLEDIKPRQNTETIASQNQLKTQDGLQIVNYSYKPNSKHTILFFLNADLKGSTAKNLLDVYHKVNYKNFGFKVEILELANQRFITIGNFKTLQDAIEFYAKMKEDALVSKLVYNSEKFYISNENLDILYISSGWEQYLSFYEKNYK